mgnify:CR=1 FL=1
MGILAGNPGNWACVPLSIRLHDGLQSVHDWKGTSVSHASHVLKMIGDAAFFFIKRESVIHSPEPAAADSIERPGRGSEKVNHGKITVGRERQVSDDGGKPKFNVLSESLCA